MSLRLDDISHIVLMVARYARPGNRSSVLTRRNAFLQKANQFFTISEQLPGMLGGKCEFSASALAEEPGFLFQRLTFGVASFRRVGSAFEEIL